jgi:hypothetical protein
MAQKMSNATSVGDAGLLVNAAVSYQNPRIPLGASQDNDEYVLHLWADSVILQDSLAAAG